ncbi:YmdB family metallophosphoesterase [Campylobacter corcagiensis]|uniref:YmdB family metallophosphoesterase n=2 Tax=Campylobacter corcagiensis TaxID=1448857 RepID=A0A7M1LHW5_9BACT|nr:YmdB family metallophosphoesterase [Campylobacter corcagiensis]
MLEQYVKVYKDKFQLDFVVANCENASGGFGLSSTNALEIFDYGVDGITGGNHSFDKKDIIPLMEKMPIIRPFNHYDAPGSGVLNLEKNGENLSIINMLGIMGSNIAKNAFLVTNEALKLCKSKNILIDFHGQMTSEKMAYMWEFKGKVSAIFGTHTHVGTDDLKIELGTSYVSDAGLVGARQGVIGMDGDISVAGFKSGLKQSFKVNNTYKKIFQMIIVEVLDGKSSDVFKVKVIDDQEIITRGYIER